MSKLILGSRGSRLALAQAELVKNKIEKELNLQVEIKIITSIGDKDQITQLHLFRGLGIFTGTIEAALLKGEIDLAVHSLKDLPIVDTTGLNIITVLKRHSPGDVMIIKQDKLVESIPIKLKSYSKIATSSPRRQSQLMAFDDTIIPLDIRGNVDTRISRLEMSSVDGLILAASIFERLEFEIPENIEVIKLPLEFFPATPGQGAIAIQTRKDELEEFKSIGCEGCKMAVDAERSLLTLFGGGCDLKMGINIKKIDSGWRLYSSKADGNWTVGQNPNLHRLSLSASNLEDLLVEFRELIFSDNSEEPTNGKNGQLNGNNKSLMIARSKEESDDYYSSLKDQYDSISFLPVLSYQVHFDRIKDAEILDWWLYFDWLVVSSQHSIPLLKELIKIHPRKPFRVAVVGSITASKLREIGLPVHLVSTNGMKELKEILSEALEIYPGKVLYLSGERISSEPSDDYQRIIAYTSVENELEKKDRIDDLLVFSKHSANTIIKQLGSNCCNRWIAIGNTTGEYLKSQGLNTIIAENNTPKGVLQILQNEGQL